MSDFDALFGDGRARRGKVTRLDPSAVTHDKLDEGVLDGLRYEGKQFDRIFEEAPEVGEDAYEPWGDLVADVFFIYHTYDEPEVRDSDEVKPSRRLHAQIIEQLLRSESFRDTRRATRLDEVAAALAVMAIVEAVGDLLEGALAEQAENAQRLSGAERRHDEAVDANDKIREEVGDGDLTDEQREQMRKNAKQRAEAAAEIEQLISEQSTLLPGPSRQAIDKAAEEAKRRSQALGSLPGSGTGKMAKLPADKMFALAKRIEESSNAREVFKRFGRFEREMRYQRTNRVVGGREEIVDVEVGNDLSRALPSELVKLGHPLLKLDFMRRLHEASLLQYEMVGEEEVGRGPVVVALDTSGSMDGAKNWWARGTTLGLLALAHRERRSLHVIEFDTKVTRTITFEGSKPIDPEKVVAFAESAAQGGGTKITAGLREAVEVIETAPEFRAADIVLITDGQDRIRDEDRELAERARTLGVRLHGVAVGQASNPWLNEICDDQVSAQELAAPSEATGHLAEVLT